MESSYNVRALFSSYFRPLWLLEFELKTPFLSGVMTFLAFTTFCGGVTNLLYVASCACFAKHAGVVNFMDVVNLLRFANSSCVTKFIDVMNSSTWFFRESLFVSWSVSFATFTTLICFVKVDCHEFCPFCEVRWCRNSFLFRELCWFCDLFYNVLRDLLAQLLVIGSTNLFK